MMLHSSVKWYGQYQDIKKYWQYIFSYIYIGYKEGICQKCSLKGTVEVSGNTGVYSRTAEFK